MDLEINPTVEVSELTCYLLVEKTSGGVLGAYWRDTSFRTLEIGSITSAQYAQPDHTEWHTLCPSVRTLAVK